jgi:tetratricopeptide (TPR) repeat protein
VIIEEQALVLGDQGKVDEAAAAIRAGAKGKPNVGQLIDIAQMYEKAKRYSDSEKTLDEAEKAAATDGEKLNIYFQRGALYDQEKKYDQSEVEFKKVLAMDPNNASALNYLGYSLADRNVRMDEASQMVKKALDLDPTNYAYMDSLGWVYYREGKLDQAEELLMRAVEQTKDPTVHDHLGDVYFKEGKTREAVAQWQIAVKESNAGNSDMEPEQLAKVNQKLQSAQAQLAKHQ